MTVLDLLLWISRTMFVVMLTLLAAHYLGLTRHRDNE
jgi:hypothetical protein